MTRNDAARARATSRGAPVVRDKRRLDPETGEVRDRPRRRRSAPDGRAGAGRRSGRRAGGDGRGACSRPSSPSAPPTCSGCRRSTPTTAAGSSATARRCASRRWPTCSPTCSGARRHRPGPRARRARGRLQGRRGGARGDGRQARSGALRRGRATRSTRPARGADPQVLRRGDRADRRRRSSSRATGSATGSCGRPGSAWPSRSRPIDTSRRHDGGRRGRMSTKDYLDKDYYKALGVTKDATPTRSRRPTASSPASTTRTPTRATPRPRTGSRRSPRPTTCSPTPSAARSTTRPARCSAPAGSRRGPGGPAARRRRHRVRPRRPVRPARRAGRRRPRRRPRRHLRRPRRRPHRRASPRRRRRVRGDARFADALDGATVPLRMTSEQPCPTCRGTGRPRRHHAASARLPRHRSDQPQPGRVRVRRAVPGVPGPRPGRRRPRAPTAAAAAGRWAAAR